MTVNNLLVSSKLGHNAKYVLAFLLACDGFLCINRSRLAVTMNISNKSMRSALAELDKAGVKINTDRHMVEIDWDETERRFKCWSSSTEDRKTA